MEGPGLPQSIWRYKWLVGGLVVLGILIAFLLARPRNLLATKALCAFTCTAEEVAAGDTERTVTSHAQLSNHRPWRIGRLPSLAIGSLARSSRNGLKSSPRRTTNFITIRALRHNA